MRPTLRRRLSCVVLVVLFALSARSTGAQTTERVSVASDGTEGNDVSLAAAFSADGRFVAFDSAASDFVAGDTNGSSDVFVHDRQTGTTERVSVASDGTEGNASSGLIGFAAPPALSADGRFVAFRSAATNLVAGDTNGATDVFVHDRQGGTTERVSVASDGTESNAASLSSALSEDGRFVAFHSAATNLVAGDTNGATDVFVHDRQTGTTERVSVASDETQGDSASTYPALSGDGRFVAFDSAATNLVAGDTNGATDVFVHDRQMGTTERVSVASNGTQANGNSGGFFSFPALSADGRFVAFESDATNLVAGDTNDATDVFVHDRQTGTTERVSVASSGVQGSGFSAWPALSTDGRFVAFHSTSTNLVAGDANGATDVFVHDRQAGTTERVSLASNGSQGNDSSAGPALSADGLQVAFHSTATNLVAGDANLMYDVFVHEQTVSTTTTSTSQATMSTSSSTTTVTETTTTLPTTDTSFTTTNPTSTTTLPTTTATTSPPTTLSSTTVSPPSTTTTTPPCELARVPEDSPGGVECAISALRATLTQPPPACRCKRCPLEAMLDQIARRVMQGYGASMPKKCKWDLSKARRAAKSLRARVGSLTRRRCLAPATSLDSQVVDLIGRIQALFKSRFCVSKKDGPSIPSRAGAQPNRSQTAANVGVRDVPTRPTASA